MAFSAMQFAGRGQQQQQQGGGGGGARGNFGGGGQSAGGQGGSKVFNPIRCVSVKQLLNANRVGEGVTVIDGREATQVTVCGRIVEYENGAAATAVTAKHIGYRISDGTGLLVVRQWTDQGAQQELLPIGQFIRCSGSVKVWMDSPLVTGSIRVILDANEFTYHLLECTLTHLRISQGTRSAKRSASAGVPQQQQQQQQMMMMGGMQQQQQQQGGAMGGGNVPCTEAVLRAIRGSGRKDLGLSVEEIAAAVARYSFSTSDVRNALRSLSGEGKVFLCGDNRYAM